MLICRVPAGKMVTAIVVETVGSALLVAVIVVFCFVLAAMLAGAVYTLPFKPPTDGDMLQVKA